MSGDAQSVRQADSRHLNGSATSAAGTVALWRAECNCGWSATRTRESDARHAAAQHRLLRHDLPGESSG